MNIRAKVLGWLVKGAEGSFRGPATAWSSWGTPFEVSFGDGYQQGLTLATGRDAQHVPTAYACVMATAKAVAMCYPAHIVIEDDGKAVKSTTSPASRVLRKPNPYQTWPQFVLNAICAMLFDGEAFVQLVRDERNAVTQMHLLPRGYCSPYVDPSTGDVYYSIGASPMLPTGMQYMAPARDVMHLRQYTPRHPLIGESPVTAAALALGVNIALSGNQAAFFNQMNRPSGILSTDQALTRDQMKMLRDAFDEQAKGLNAGKVPVLGNGMKFSQMSITSQDAQLVEAQRMSIEEIARVYGVPLAVIGDLTKSTLNNAESTINFWLATGLGSIMENLERSFDAAFSLPANQYVEFDEKALLRMDFQSRIEGLAKGVQGGIYSPNEAREVEGKPPVDGGDSVFLQQQMVSVDLLEEMNKADIAAKIKPATPSPATPAGPTEPPEPPEPPEPDAEDDEEEVDADVARALVIATFARKRA